MKRSILILVLLAGCSRGASAEVVCDRWREDFRSAADGYQEAVEAYLATNEYDRVALEFQDTAVAKEAAARIMAATEGPWDRLARVEGQQPEGCPRPDSWLDNVEGLDDLQPAEG